MTFSTRLLIRSALISPYSHLCQLFCHHICSCPLTYPTCASDPTLKHWRTLLFLSSSLPLTCFLHYSVSFAWYYEHFGIFCIFSEMMCNFAFIFYILLPFKTREKRIHILCCIFRLMMKWLFVLWHRLLTVYHPLLRLLHETIHYFEIVLSLSNSPSPQSWTILQ